MAENSTMKTMAKLLAQDRETISAQEKSAAKGNGYMSSPSMDFGESITIKKADAGGMILCWYGPNGSRDIIVKTAAEAAPLIEQFFKDASEDDAENDD